MSTARQCAPCLLPIGAVGNRAVTTIEAMQVAHRREGQKAWLDLEVVSVVTASPDEILVSRRTARDHT